MLRGRQREAAEAEVRAAYGNYFPQVSHSYRYDWGWMRPRAWESQAEGTRMRGDGAQGYSVGVVVTLPVFDGFMRENALKTARSKLDRAVQAEGLARQQCARGVSGRAGHVAAGDRPEPVTRRTLKRRRTVLDGAAACALRSVRPDCGARSPSGHGTWCGLVQGIERIRYVRWQSR